MILTLMCFFFLLLSWELSKQKSTYYCIDHPTSIQFTITISTNFLKGVFLILCIYIHVKQTDGNASLSIIFLYNANFRNIPWFGILEKFFCRILLKNSPNLVKVALFFLLLLNWIYFNYISISKNNLFLPGVYFFVQLFSRKCLG